MNRIRVLAIVTAITCLLLLLILDPAGIDPSDSSLSPDKSSSSAGERIEWSGVEASRRPVEWSDSMAELTSQTGTYCLTAKTTSGSALPHECEVRLLRGAWPFDSSPVPVADAFEDLPILGRIQPGFSLEISDDKLEWGEPLIAIANAATIVRGSWESSGATFTFAEAGTIRVSLVGMDLSHPAYCVLTNDRTRAFVKAETDYVVFNNVEFGTYLFTAAQEETKGYEFIRHEQRHTERSVTLSPCGRLGVFVTDADSGAVLPESILLVAPTYGLHQLKLAPGRFEILGIPLGNSPIPVTVKCAGYPDHHLELSIPNSGNYWDQSVPLQKGQRYVTQCRFNGVPIVGAVGSLCYQVMNWGQFNMRSPFGEVSATSSIDGGLEFLLPSGATPIGLYVYSSNLCASMVSEISAGVEESIPAVISLKKCDPLRLKFDCQTAEVNSVVMTMYVPFSKFNHYFCATKQVLNPQMEALLHVYPQPLLGIATTSIYGERYNNETFRNAWSNPLTIVIMSPAAAAVRLLGSNGDPEHGIVELRSRDRLLLVEAHATNAQGWVRFEHIPLEGGLLVATGTAHGAHIEVDSIHGGGPAITYQWNAEVMRYLPKQ